MGPAQHPRQRRGAGPFPTESAWEKLAPIPKANVGAASADEVPMGRFGRMPELCNLLTFLQADGCDYLTGQNIAIDGGHHLAAPSTFRRAGQADARRLGRGQGRGAPARRRRRHSAAPAEPAHRTHQPWTDACSPVRWLQYP
jgi:hypothetical protein